MAFLLSEALCCAPLTGTEHAVCHFIMRRTYGMASFKDRTTGKSAPLTAEEIAAGTANPRSTVHKAVRNLVAAKVVAAEPLGANHYSYGMNPNVAEWGLADVDWKAAKTALRENLEAGVYGRKWSDLLSPKTDRAKRTLSPKTDRPITKNGQSYAQKRLEEEPLSPSAAGAQGTSTESITESITENVLTSSPASADAEPAAPVDPPAAPHEDTPAQAAANACLALYGLTHQDLTGPQAGAYYKAMHALISQLEHGAEELQAWADEQAVFGPRVLGSGSKPERSIPAAVRKAVTASSWQAAFTATRASPGGKSPGPGQRWLLNDDDSRTYERDWTAEQRLSIDMAVAAGIWDQARGIATDDPRHPDCPPAIRRAIQQGARP